MAKVIIIQRTLKFYRLPFYNFLKSKLEKAGITLVLIYGKDDTIKFNDAEVKWGVLIRNYKINVLGSNLYFQPVLKYIHDADLIIVEQASKLLINYYLWLLNLIGCKKLAFWGHGISLQSHNSSSFSEFVKIFMTRKVFWFYAYNNLSKRILEDIGYPTKRITTVNNTIDVENILEEKKKWNEKDLIQLKEQLGIQSNNTCIFIGGMYKDKRLEFLIKSIIFIKKSIPDFEFIFIGDGPDKDLIIKASYNNRWIHYVGPKNEIEKVPYFLISKFLLNPGLVGLSIIDSFIFEVPLITTDCKLHSPEIDYLENGINGLMIENNITRYSSTVVDLLLNNDKRLILVEGCKQYAKKYTMTNMVDNFYDGIVHALNSSFTHKGKANDGKYEKQI
jgi:glycosyltransferase involved in cell wall biosynthesis